MFIKKLKKVVKQLVVVKPPTWLVVYPNQVSSGRDYRQTGQILSAFYALGSSGATVMLLLLVD